MLVLLATLGGSAAWASVDDPYRAEQWGLDRIRIDEAWGTTRGSGAVVAVVDTGVALDHPDLFDRITKRPDGSVIGIDLVDDDDDPSDEHGHGTLVAGIVAAAADDGIGIAGVAPDARILPVRVLGADGSGDSETVGRGVRWAADQGADVINVSLEAVAPRDGGAGGPGVPTSAVRYAAERGAVVVAAAGNQPGSAAGYPADSPIVLVGASDRRDRSASFSNVGRLDGLVAPGVEITSTWCRRVAGGCDTSSAQYGVAEGTSFAAPHVSGVAALLASEGFDAVEVRERLLDGAVDTGPSGPDSEHGAGRLDAAASLAGAPPRTASTTQADRQPAPDPSSEPAPAPAAPAPEPSPPADRAEVDVADDPVAPPEPDEPAPPVEADSPPEPDPDPAADREGSPDDTVERNPEVTVPDADPVALGVPTATGATGTAPLTLQLLAALLVVATMSVWSAAARRLS
ncbi:MAG: S8 family serine peptidase [Nitriliruptor sp.]